MGFNFFGLGRPKKVVPEKELKLMRNIDYNIKLHKDGRFNISLNTDVPKTWFLEAVTAANKKFGIGASVTEGDTWKADSRFLGYVKNKLGPVFNTIISEVRKDLPNFNIILLNIEDAEFKIVGECVEMKINVSGVYNR